MSSMSPHFINKNNKYFNANFYKIPGGYSSRLVIRWVPNFYSKYLNYYMDYLA